MLPDCLLASVSVCFDSCDGIVYNEDAAIGRDHSGETGRVDL